MCVCVRACVCVCVCVCIVMCECISNKVGVFNAIVIVTSLCSPVDVVSLFPSTGAQVPIKSYVCTQPNSPNDDGACNVSNGLRHCVITNGVRPTLLHYTDGDNTVPYRWVGIISPFVVLDIPQGWCVGSVRMEFNTAGSRLTPFVNVTIHNMTQLSNNSLTVQAMYSGGTEDPSVVLNLTSLTCGRYIRIDMSSSTIVILTEIAVFGVGECSLCIVNCTVM